MALSKIDPTSLSSWASLDKKFKAEAINGELDFPNDINNCYRKMDEVKKGKVKTQKDKLKKLRGK